ncbi:hypothetical protein [Flavobacterium endophyticum]|nr:hypothetical protein [Flavobacterium endophyticum]
MSRNETMREFCHLHNIDINHLQVRQYFSHLFNFEYITDEQINNFIIQKYNQEREIRRLNEESLVDQLSRLQHFDWGGSFGNSLEKNIVNNYVKRIQSFDRINEEIEGSLLSSLRGYTLNSWYNHWTSILIEDLFKDHTNVLPTVGLVKKIDFFINNIPFDLKVTYFPEQLLAQKLQARGYGNELTRLKRVCRQLNIFIPNDLKDKQLKLHLYNKVSEDPRDEARLFITDLKHHKREIISEAEENPEELKVWFYENQGEARFDASNRFFLVLTDEADLTNSWKLKRNIVFLREKINEHLNNIILDIERLNTEFYWAKNQRTYNCKSDILFIKQTENI